jgi:hypothetical protein
MRLRRHPLRHHNKRIETGRERLQHDIQLAQLA